MSASAPPRQAVNAVAALLGYGLDYPTFIVFSKAARPPRNVTVYSEDSRREPLLHVLQDQRIALLVRTDTVTLSDGAVLARLRKPYAYNVIRKRWFVESPEGLVLALAVE